MKCIGLLAAVALFLVVEGSVLPYARYGYQYFYGVYPGHCADQDGMYHNGPDSFVVCSNGVAHVQACAPGSANGPSTGYTVGSHYNKGDFCNINLNDLGYSVHQRYNNYHGYPYAYHGYGYGPGYPYFW